MREDVRIELWSQGDLPLLHAANTPEMTRFLGGPETDEQLADRHARYLRLNAAGTAHMFRVVVDGSDDPVGGIGWWHVEHDGTPAVEAGWNTLPAHQGQGVAGAALALLISDAAAHSDRALMVAYPGVENAGSNALCRAAGFALQGSATEDFRGAPLTFNIWTLRLHADS